MVKTLALHFLDWFFRVWVAIDQLLNVALCDGQPDETMSSNAYRMNQSGGRWGFMCPVINFIVYPFQRDHCRKAFESELLRLQSPPSERDPTVHS